MKTELREKLTAAVNKRVIIVFKNGKRQPGKLNHAGDDATRPGTWFIILDIGISKVYSEDDIKDVKIVPE